MRFGNRVEAGRLLAWELLGLRGDATVVLGLPRGGVPVAFEVARVLGAPLDVIVVRKVGVPWQPELAMGAVGEDGARVVNPEVVRAVGVDADELAAAQAYAAAEVEGRLKALRGDRPRVSLDGRTAIVVDDGIATGCTARAACQVARVHGAARVVLAVPVAPAGTAAMLKEVADEVVCLRQPSWFQAVEQFYEDFTPTTDARVMALLDAAARTIGVATTTADDPPDVEQDVTIDIGTVRLAGQLSLPFDAHGLVVFAHGSGSGRHSPRNRYVAGILRQAGLGTLLFDLLTVKEEADPANVFAVDLLADRLGDAVAWVGRQPDAADLPVGLFGASTGAAAALCAAADPTTHIAAIVSRGGRPDLAGANLRRVRAPTLLIVGGLDDAVLELNRRARTRLGCPNRLAVVRGATHLFEEPGTLPTAARLAAEWFTIHLVPGP